MKGFRTSYRPEPPRTRTCGEVARETGFPLYTLPGIGEVVFKRLTPQGWPVFNKASDPTYFGPLTLQGEAGAAFANWARQKGLAQ